MRVRMWTPLWALVTIMSEIGSVRTVVPSVSWLIGLLSITYLAY